jgi:hypothetical protein
MEKGMVLKRASFLYWAVELLTLKRTLSTRVVFQTPIVHFEDNTNSAETLIWSKLLKLLTVCKVMSTFTL